METAIRTAPASWYSDPSCWPRERKHIFARAWQFATHVSDLPAPGCWRAETLAGYPIVIVRGEDDVLRAFHNVCRHRAGPLTNADSGKCEGALTCQYHGWRYALDGRLRSARDFGPASDFDIRDFSLFPVQIDVWRGLIFVAIDAGTPPLRSFLAPLDARLADTDWRDMHIALRRSHDLRCNWKTYVENYLEGYHVPAMHPGLDAEIVAADYRVRVEGAIAIHEVPMRDLNPVYDGLWAWAWPNLGFNIYARGLMIERMAPNGQGGTRLEYLYLTPAGEDVSPETLKMSDAVTAEDKWITERVQENLDAGVYDTGRLSPKHEGAVAAFQKMVGDALGQA
ncbi:MAG: phenylpropionate dioxygenase [Alphaproteobacteria bacterium]|nr:MAG: phenylpropionate dioxygenase [Caulobacteraceae bacterium]TPW06510.1 MAG: phenylpropionate dioxygenase [Alphaproteobacteria bacterium]